jgi:glycosyltransferase involved in cell wall biosynthesis
MDYWVSEKDGGQSGAINKGWARSTGDTQDILAWINSDDIYHVNVFEKVAIYFEQHPDVDMM